MNEQLSIELTKLISKAAIDGTLTQNAVSQFESVMKGYDELKQKNEDLQKLVTEKNATLNSQTSKIEELSKVVKLAGEAELEMQQREEKQLTLELTAKFEALRVADHKDLFKLIFRNLETRRNVFTPMEGLKSDENNYNRVTPMVQENIETTSQE